jgi:tRNA(adenine34) deaminase
MHDCTLYVTLQPCDMCTAAIKLFRVKRLVFGAYRPEKMNSKYEIDNTEVQGGVLREQCAQLLSDFFREQRKAKEKSQAQSLKS